MACLLWTSPAWKMQARDEWIGWSDEQRRCNLQWIVNNGRFLILPWVRVKGLASKILALSARQMPRDWESRYGHRPLLLETLVDAARFRGTCYRAANWIHVGQTTGRGRMDREHKAHGQAIKDIYVYPLVRDARQRLCGINIEESFIMPTKKSAVPPEIYQLKVTLLGTSPPIWRRLLVPADLTLAQLHDVLQAAMGWEDCHMHEFSVGHRHFGKPDPEDRLMGMPSVENERTVRLSGVLGRVGAKAIYTYDFGDSWEHGIVLEKRLPADPGTAYPVCTGGQLACPPEDCGGIPGFYDLLDALGDPTHEQHDELLDWIGDDYDPDAFSIEDVNRMLMPLRRRRGNTSRGRAPAR